MSEPQNPAEQTSSIEWNDWTRAVAFVRDRLEAYARNGLIRTDQIPALANYYQTVLVEAQKMQAGGAARYSKTALPSPSLCWNCSAARLSTANYCPRCGRVQDADGVDSVRYLTLLQRTAIKLHSLGLLELNQVHAIEAESSKELDQFKRRLEANRLSGVELFRLRHQARSEANSAIINIPPELPGTAPTSQSPQVAGDPIAPPPLPNRRTVLEVLLDPQSIQWLLASGGLLLVVGLIVYLASLGIFRNASFMAALIGTGSIAVLLAGWAILLKTRFHTIGRAITLLACLALPLNLWFYHSQGLMTLDGHLWVPAAFICLLYAASARVLKDSLFVYVMMAGIAMTGLLILTDLNKFNEIASPALLLMVLGLIAIHVERVFVPDETSPFSRKRFGLAFFFSGQGLIAASLGLLLGAQIVGWLWQPFFHSIVDDRPLIATQTSLKILALGIVCAAAYAWIYSTVVVRRKGVYAYLAAGAVLWAQVLVIDIWAVDVGIHVVILVMAITALLAIVGQKTLGDDHELGRSLRMLGVLLSCFAVALAVSTHFRATWDALHHIWPYEVTALSITAIVLSAIISRLGAWVSLPNHPRTAATYFFCSATAVLIAVAGLLSIWGLSTWHHQALLLGLVPMAYLVASIFYGGKPSAAPAFLVARLAMAVVMVSVVFSAITVAPSLVDPIPGSTLNLWLAAIAIEAAIFYALISIWHGRDYAIYVATGMVCAALWLVFGFFALPATLMINGYALLGLLLLVVYRLAVLDDLRKTGLSYAAFVCGNGLLALAVVVSVLMTLADMLGKRVGAEQLTLTSGLAVMLLIAAMLTRNSSWRRFHVLGFAVETALAVLCLQKQLNLTAWQNFEGFMLIAGAITLISAHVALFRGREQGGETVTIGMPLGALMICLPLAASMLYFRFWAHNVSLFDEVALLTFSIMLFVAGVMLKVRATTLFGATFGILHLLVLLVHVGMKAQLTLGIYLTVGGGLIFAIGLILSLCRERLLSLPDRYRARDGVFKVLNWR